MKYIKIIDLQDVIKKLEAEAKKLQKIVELGGKLMAEHKESDYV